MSITTLKDEINMLKNQHSQMEIKLKDIYKENAGIVPSGQIQRANSQKSKRKNMIISTSSKKKRKN